VLTAIKERYAAAKTGHDLLKRKSDAIKVNLNNILKKILVVSRQPGRSKRHRETSGWTTDCEGTVCADSHCFFCVSSVFPLVTQTKRRVGASIKESFFSFTEAHWAAGDFKSVHTSFEPKCCLLDIAHW
jgi:hypothetical protein